MKGLYTIFGAALLCGGAWLYAENSEADLVFSQETSDSSNWTIFAASGNSGTTFTKMTNQKPTDCTYSVSMWNYSESQKNLWLSTPAIELTEGVSYNIELQYQTWTNFKLENFEIYVSDKAIASQTDADNMANATAVYTASNMTANKNEWLPLTIEGVSGKGSSYIVFHVSGACQGRFSIADVKVKGITPSVPKPLAPTALTAEAANDGSLEVSLAWTLPTENDAAEALTGDNEITAVNVYRDDEKVATVEGAADRFVDTEATGLTAGAHSYAVSVVANGYEGARSEIAEVAWVGPWSFSEKTVTVDNSAPATAWTYSQTATSGVFIRSNTATPSATIASNSVQLFTNATQANYEAWISSPQLNVIAGRAYKISFYYRHNPNTQTEIGGVDAYVSTDRAAASAEAAQKALEGTQIFATSAKLGTVTSNTPWEVVEFKGYQADEAPIYVNFHVTGPICKGLYITALAIEEYVVKPFAPEAPANLTASAAANQVLEVALNWTNPTKSTDGDAFTEEQTIEQINVYRDDFETPVVELEGDVTSFTDNAETGLTPGAHSYKVQAVVAGKVSELSNEASVVYVGPATTQTLPWSPTLAGLTNDEFNVMWLSYCPDHYNLNWTNRPVGLFIMNSTGTTANSWLISAPLALDEGKEYTVEYSITSSASGFVPEVYIGFVDSTTPESFIACAQATIGSAGSECTLKLPAAAVAEMLREEGKSTDYRLAIRDVTADPENSYNLIVTKLKASESTDTGIGVITADNIAGKAVSTVYDLAGRKLNKSIGQLPAGVYVVKLSDGTTLKIKK